MTDASSLVIAATTRSQVKQQLAVEQERDSDTGPLRIDDAEEEAMNTERWEYVIHEPPPLTMPLIPKLQTSKWRNYLAQRLYSRGHSKSGKRGVTVGQPWSLPTQQTAIQKLHTARTSKRNHAPLIFHFYIFRSTLLDCR